MRPLAIAIVTSWLLAAPRHADAKGCHEDSDVVGLEKCKRFGQWSRDSDAPRLSMDFGFVAQHLMIAPYTLGTTLSSRGTTPVGGGSQQDVGANAYGYEQTMRYAFNPLLYTGIDWMVGGFPNAPVMPGPPTLNTLFMASHALLGAHVERFRVALSGELAFGGYIAGFNDCPNSACTQGKSVLQGGLDVEARARVEVFFHPDVAVGVGYGQSVSTPENRTLLIYIGAHFRPLDGML